METIDIRLNVRAPVEKVWRVLSDHEGYADYKGVSQAKLLVKGHTEKNGLGAVRLIKARGVRFIEEIVSFDPPKRFEYIVRRCNLPLKHELGSIELNTWGGETEIHWVSKYEVPLPLIGEMMAKIFQPITSRRFLRLLEQMKEKLEEKSSA